MKDFRYYINLIESAEYEQLDEGPVGKALATAALALGLNFGQQVNADEVYVYKDVQGELQTTLTTDQVPGGTEYFVIDSDKPNQAPITRVKPNTNSEVPDESHITSGSTTVGIDDDLLNHHSVRSTNVVKMDFPYEDHQGVLVLGGSDGRDTPSLALIVNGQITSDRVKIKIDNLPTFETSMQTTDARKSGHIGLIGPWIIGNDRTMPEKDWYAFMNEEEAKAFNYYMKKKRSFGDEYHMASWVVGNKAMERTLKDAKQLKIQVGLYNNSRAVYTFNISHMFDNVNYKTDFRKKQNKFQNDNPPK